jgi:hypothetical protein
MLTYKTYGVREIAAVAIALALALGFSTQAFAQSTTYTPPAGYTEVTGGPIGVYYNPNTGLYFYSGNNVFTTNPPTIPTGYQTYNYGTYYNSSTGQYYNPVTGQYSSTAPTGPAQRDASGNFVLPSGYNSLGNGSYYNSSTGQYYDPMTGFYSNSAPTGTVTLGPGGVMTTTYQGGQWMPNLSGTTGSTGTTNTGTPGFPNTGAGGEAAANWTLLALGAAVVVGSGVYFARKTA